MDVGLMLVMTSYGWEEGTDAQMWDEELRLVEIAADYGFDSVWSAEHHFNDLFVRAGQSAADDPHRGEASQHRRGNGGGDSALAHPAAGGGERRGAGHAERRDGCGWGSDADWRDGSSRPSAST